MLNLLILRHAKSRKDIPNIPDHDRPLDERGLKDAPRMGKVLVQNYIVPDLIISSTAKRAYHTAQLAAESCDYHKDIQTTLKLYEASPEGFIHVLNKISSGNNFVMIVGHNPDLESFVHILTGQTDIELPTAALVHLTLPIKDWSELTLKTKAALKNIWRPKEL